MSDLDPTAAPTSQDEIDSVVAEPEGGFSARAKTIAITPKVTGGISMVCSAYLVYHILSNRRRRSLTYQRLIAVLSLCDFVTSFGYFLSTWPLPVGNNFGAIQDIDDADGNNTLCTTQGVLLHWGLTTAVANVVLSAHYLLVVRFKFTEQALRKAEPFYLTAIIGVGLICTSISLGLGIYGYNPYSRNIWCFIFIPCENGDEGDCIQYTVILRWALYFAPLWVCIVTCTVLLLLLYCTVRRIEMAASRWRMPPLSSLQFGTDNSQSKMKMKQTKRVAMQAALYVAFFIVVWLPLLVLNTLNIVRKTWFNPEEVNGFVVLFSVMFFQPLQGLFSLIVYRRFGVVKVVSRRVSSFSRYISNRVSSSIHLDSSINLRGSVRIEELSAHVSAASVSEPSVSEPFALVPSCVGENGGNDSHLGFAIDEDAVRKSGDDSETDLNICHGNNPHGKNVRFSNHVQEQEISTEMRDFNGEQESIKHAAIVAAAARAAEVDDIANVEHIYGDYEENADLEKILQSMADQWKAKGQCH